jgi:hypothetical protein
MNADSKNKNRINKSDNLQEIKGIGPDYERALQQFGVLTFAQLAEFKDAQELQKALKKSGIEINLWKIEKYGWIDQAKKKVKSQKVPPAVEEVVVSKRDQKEAISIKPWKEHAAFIVSFDHYTDEDDEESWRTRVYKAENGDEIEFEGTDPSAWIKWIFEQSNLTIVETHIDEAVKAEKSDPSETELVVTQVPVAKTGKQLNLVNVQVLSPSTAVPRRELIIRVHFELIGSEVEIWTEEIPSYRLELYLLDIEKQATELVASTQKRLEPGILEYEIGEAIPIPPPGRYKIYVLLFSLPPTNMIVTRQGPIINVVPHPVSAQ